MPGFLRGKMYIDRKEKNDLIYASSHFTIENVRKYPLFRVMEV